MKRLLLTSLLFGILTAYPAVAQGGLPLTPCGGEGSYSGSCAPGLNLGPGQFQATPFVDTVKSGSNWPSYLDRDNNIVSLYGSYGNDESQPTTGPAYNHYAMGKTLANNVQPLCRNGLPPQPGQGGLCVDYAPAPPWRTTLRHPVPESTQSESKLPPSLERGQRWSGPAAFPLSGLQPLTTAGRSERCDFRWGVWRANP